VIPSDETVIPSNDTIPSIPPIVGPPSNVTVEGINRAIDALFPEMAGQLEGPNPSITFDDTTISLSDLLSNNNP
jgi:hypothetical protein